MQYYKRQLTGERSFTILTFTHVACYVYDHKYSNTSLNSIVVNTVFSRLINQKVHSSSTFNTR